MEFRSKNKIIVILGPTSSGKSDIAIKLAQKFDGEIVSADSRQIYRGMDIGTGKITKKQQDLVKHWMIDIISPKSDYSVAKFKKRADKIIIHILGRGKLPIICGGTGFWIKSTIDNITYPEVKPDPRLRRKLAEKSTEELFTMLRKLDPKRARNIDAKNKVRLIRAIEICKAIGSVPRLEASDKKWKFLQIGIKLEKKKLHENIRKRLEKRFKSGMIEEVRTLKNQGLSFKKIRSFGLGYFWIPLYLEGKISREELFQKVYQSEKDYAKRQMTWFQKDKRIKWLSNHPQIERKVDTFLKN